MASPVTSTSDLLRSLGLSVDGPARWGNPVASRAAGVFVVELPGGADSPPIDMISVRRWVERVPAMLLDGEPSTAQEVARQLAAFWLPGEPILYVGRSAKSIGARVGSMYATELGDARPYPAGHWLKTLSVLTSMRVWWAETNAHEEYEDALLAAVAGRASPEAIATLPDASVVLPFANLSGPGGPKRHGLTHALRDVDSTTVSATSGPARRRAAARPRSAASTPREPRLKVSRPVPDPTYVSREGLDRLTAELDELRANVRPQVIARVKAARELGDLKENADYEYARKEQSFVEGRIKTLEAMITTGVVIDAPAAAETVHLGSTVVVESDGEQDVYLVVGSAEADPPNGRISYISPVGRALMGARAGDEVSVQLPRGSIKYRIREIR